MSATPRPWRANDFSEIVHGPDIVGYFQYQNDAELCAAAVALVDDLASARCIYDGMPYEKPDECHCPGCRARRIVEGR